MLELDRIPCFWFLSLSLILLCYQVILCKRATLTHKGPEVVLCSSCFIKFSSICWVLKASHNPIPSYLSSLNFFTSKLFFFFWVILLYLLYLCFGACALPFFKKWLFILLFYTLRLRSGPISYTVPFVLASLRDLCFLGGKMRLLWGLN